MSNYPNIQTRSVKAGATSVLVLALAVAVSACPNDVGRFCPDQVAQFQVGKKQQVGERTQDGKPRMSIVTPWTRTVPYYAGGGDTGIIEARDVSKENRDVVSAIETKAHRPKMSNPFALAGEAKKALILYDSAGQAGWMGSLYGQHLTNLMTHFNSTSTLKPVEQYVENEMETYDAVYYFGIYYNNPLPETFKTDVLETEKPMMWFGYNLWQIAWVPDMTAYNTDFENKFGFRFLNLDGSVAHTMVEYKGVNLAKETYDPVVGVTQVQNPLLAEVKATLKHQLGQTAPYVTKGANLWYVADNPFTYVSWITNMDRSLAVYDMFHDVMNSGAVTKYQAFIRVEDVHPNVPPENLRALADVFKAENVPFVVCVIPEYRDPLGTYNDGLPVATPIKKNSAFVNALKYMVKKGGQIIQHGWTHQYGSVLNPYDGTSGPDFEFFRVILNERGEQQLVGPVPEDSLAWANSRVNTGKKLLKDAGGWQPTGWVTPHYLASPVNFQAFSSQFGYSLCRGLYFSTDQNGSLRYLQQKIPYPVIDVFGMKRLPETIGYVDITGFAQQPPSDVADLVLRAGAHKVVRDGWAGMYFHWFREPARLRDLLRGVKGHGFQFVMPSTTIDHRAATS